MEQYNFNERNDALQHFQSQIDNANTTGYQVKQLAKQMFMYKRTIEITEQQALAKMASQPMNEGYMRKYKDLNQVQKDLNVAELEEQSELKRENEIKNSLEDLNTALKTDVNQRNALQRECIQMGISTQELALRYKEKMAKRQKAAENRRALEKQIKEVLLVQYPSITIK